MKQLNKEIIKVIKYFSFFAYYPTLDEIHTFLQVKITKNELNGELKRIKYTPVEYSMLSQNSKVKSQKLKSKIKNSNEAMKQWNNLTNRKQISQSKLNSSRFKLYIKLLSIFPQILLVGLSGSISMMNAEEDDDVDLFIITAKNRLFTGRLITLILAQLFGLRRNRETRESFNNETMKQLNNVFRNKVCLNLFFDESNLKVPKFKQTEFVGHEVLQMKPIMIKGDIYERFLKANLWVQAIFPNSNWIISKIKDQRSKTSSKLKSLKFKPVFDICALTFDLFERLAKNFQLTSINRHRTTEIITSTQLWFHPDDFEKKIKI